MTIQFNTVTILSIIWKYPFSAGRTKSSKDEVAGRNDFLAWSSHSNDDVVCCVSCDSLLTASFGIIIIFCHFAICPIYQFHRGIVQP